MKLNMTQENSHTYVSQGSVGKLKNILCICSALICTKVISTEHEFSISDNHLLSVHLFRCCPPAGIGCPDLIINLGFLLFHARSACEGEVGLAGVRPSHSRPAT